MGDLIMPKNIGDGDYMEALRIYYEAGDWISNDDFKDRLKDSIGDSKYQSTYTKIVQILSYYNFVEWQDMERNQSLRRITKSGRRFYIACKNHDQDAINAELIYALKNTVFGRFNSGAPNSDSNIEPPVVFIQAVRQLGNLTYKEFAYLLWRMHNQGASMEDAIAELEDIRNDSDKTLTLSPEAAKYKDAKPIQTLVRWGFLEQDGVGDDDDDDDVNDDPSDSIANNNQDE